MEYYSRQKCKEILINECQIKLIDNKYVISKQTSQMAKKIAREPLWQSVLHHTQKLQKNCSISERLYWIIYNIYERPICKKEGCNNFVEFLQFFLGYKLHCSYKCSANDIITRQKYQETCLEKYGVSFYSQTEQSKLNYKENWKNKSKEEVNAITEKRGNTLQSIHGEGIINNFQVPKNKEKSKETKLEKYGDEYYSYFGTKEFKNFLLKSYGVSNISKNKNIQKQKEETCLKNHNKKFGFDDHRFNSKISQELFWKIYNQLPEENKIHTYFLDLNKEFGKRDIINKKSYFYDFVITNIKMCIEFDGIFWHGLSEYKDGFFETNLGKSILENIEKDKIKQKLLENLGFKVIRITDMQYKENKEQIVKYCIQQINLRYKEILKYI